MSGIGAPRHEEVQTPALGAPRGASRLAQAADIISHTSWTRRLALVALGALKIHGQEGGPDHNVELLNTESAMTSTFNEAEGEADLAAETPNLETDLNADTSLALTETHTFTENVPPFTALTPLDLNAETSLAMTDTHASTENVPPFNDYASLGSDPSSSISATYHSSFESAYVSHSAMAA
jgi:hypothetical protein